MSFSLLRILAATTVVIACPVGPRLTAKLAATPTPRRDSTSDRSRSRTNLRLDGDAVGDHGQRLPVPVLQAMALKPIVDKYVVARRIRLAL
jgi:hypothetical protein